MATTLLEQEIIFDSTDRDMDMVHLINPAKPDYSFCGIRLTRDADGEETDCIVCEDMWESWRHEGTF